MLKRLANGIIWDESESLGYYPVDIKQQPYDADYFEKYVGYAQTELGRRITEARMALVEKYVGQAVVVDVGVGAGQFVASRDNTFGYDVNPHGVRWLLDAHRWWDPWFVPMPNATFWDSLEHFKDPREILSRCESHAFISIPIFSGPDHAERSKHFRKDEHFWYFTHDSLVKLMSKAGFILVDESTTETDLGREDIGTFAFLRVAL